VSAANGLGIDNLLQALQGRLTASLTRVELRLPAHHPLIAELLGGCRVHEQNWEPGFLRLRVDIPQKFVGRVQPFLAAPPEDAP